MKRRFIAVATFLGLSLQFATSHAVIMGISRAGNESITFADAAAFSDAAIHIGTATTYTGNTGDTVHVVLGLTSPTFNIQVLGDAHMQVSGVTVLPGSVEYDVTSLDGLSGVVTVGYDRFVNVGTTLTTGVVGGLHALSASRNPSGGVFAGSPYSLLVTMTGDWSAAGTATGQHELLSLDNDWTLDQNFSFGSGLTTVSAHIDSYINDGAHDPNLRFRLFGAAAVPEPGTFALMALALLGFRSGRRRP